MGAKHKGNRKRNFDMYILKIRAASETNFFDVRLRCQIFLTNYKDFVRVNMYFSFKKINL